MLPLPNAKWVDICLARAGVTYEAVPKLNKYFQLKKKKGKEKKIINLLSLALAVLWAAQQFELVHLPK